MNIKIIIPACFVEKLKQKARKLKNESGISHHEALDQVAQSAGFNHWHHVVEIAAITAITEDAYRHGFIVIYEGSESDVDSDFLVKDDLASHFYSDQLWWLYLTGVSQDPELQDITEEEHCEVFDEYLRSLAFFRYTGNEIPKTVEDALNFIIECNFWSPVWVSIKGQIYNTYGASAKDGDGNVLGVRL